MVFTLFYILNGKNFVYQNYVVLKILGNLLSISYFDVSRLRLSNVNTACTLDGIDVDPCCLQRILILALHSNNGTPK